MTIVFNIVLPLIAGGAFLIAFYFGVRAIQQRMQSARAPYGVGRQEARQAMQVDMVRGVFALLVALILIGVFGLGPRPAESAPEIVPPTETPLDLPTEPVEPTTIIPTIVPTSTPESAVPTPVTTKPEPTLAFPSPEPTLVLPTDTPEPIILTATVNSGVGVWLRSSPSIESEQLEWVLDGTVLTLLEGTETADEFDWQYVQTPSGNIGWVAVPFIDYDQ